MAASRSRDGRFGWLIAAVVVLAVIVLIGMGLMLPPFSLMARLFGAPYIVLNAQSPSVSQDMLTIAVDPANPGSLSARIKAIKPPNDDDWGVGVDQEDVGWLRSAHMGLLRYHHLSSPLYRINTGGTPPDVVSVSIGIPAGTDASSFDLYEYDVQKNWQFIPAHPSNDGTALVASVKRIPERLALFKNNYSAALISAAVEAGQQLTTAQAASFNNLYPSGMQPTTAGTLQGVLPAGIEAGRGYGVSPIIRNFSNPAAIDVTTVTGLLQNADLRSYHVDRLVDFAISKPYHGLVIDYRKLSADQRDTFTSFVTELAQKLHAANRGLTVTVPFPAQDGSSFNTGAYNWRAIGAVSDVQILLPLDPQIFAENGQINRMLAWAVGEVERMKLEVALSVQSVQETAGVFAPIAFADALAPLGQVVAQPNMVPPNAPIEARLSGYKAQFMPLDSSGTPAIKYFAADGTLVSTVWLTTGAALRNRLARIAAYHLAGVVALDAVSPDVMNALIAYKVNQLSDTQGKPLSLDWSVSAQGTVIATAAGAPGTPFVYKPDEHNNSIQINAQVASATLGPAHIMVSSALPPPPTATPSRAATSTPPPTSTPRPTRSPAPTETKAAFRLGSSGAYRSNRSFS